MLGAARQVASILECGSSLALTAAPARRTMNPGSDCASSALSKDRVPTLRSSDNRSSLTRACPDGCGTGSGLLSDPLKSAKNSVDEPLIPRGAHYAKPRAAP